MNGLVSVRPRCAACAVMVISRYRSATECGYRRLLSGSPFVSSWIDWLFIERPLRRPSVESGALTGPPGIVPAETRESGGGTYVH